MKLRLTHLSPALSLLLLALAWWLLAPPQLGGQTTYVIVNGNSMEPLYHRGDLVLMRVADSYEVGDIVIYQHPSIGVVIHRIIGRDGERYVFKGDHNSFIDPYHPSRGELLGAEWVFIPQAGKLMQTLRQPLWMAALAIGIGVVTMSAMIPVRGARREQRRSQPPAPTPLAARLDELLVGCAAAAALALGLTVAAFAQPLDARSPKTIPYTSAGSFSYRADAPADLYDAPEARTGDPIFPALSPTMQVSFTSGIEGVQLDSPTVSASLVARVESGGGWSRTIELQPRTVGRTLPAVVSGTLDLREVLALTDRFEQQVGLEHQSYRVVIQPEVRVRGAAGSAVVSDTFAPALTFAMTKSQLVPDLNVADGSALRPKKGGSVIASEVAPATLALLPGKPTVALARQVSAGMLVASALALALAAARHLRQRRRSGAEVMNTAYSEMIVPVERVEPAAGVSVTIEVQSVEALARLAEQHDRIILYERHGDRHIYAVQVGASLYRYALVEPEAVHLEGSPGGWQLAFLTALNRGATVGEASRSAGVPLSAAYAERESSALFARTWDGVRERRRSSVDQERA